MNKPKHTPGPWSITESCMNAWEIDGLDRSIATVNAVEDIAPEDEANARLIAAAPDLLAALQDFLHADPDVFAEELAAARAAIAKAEGK